MSHMTPDEIIRLITAFNSGKIIEAAYVHDQTNWFICCDPIWNFKDYVYRAINLSDIVQEIHVCSPGKVLSEPGTPPNLLLCWDGKTGKLKSSKVLDVQD